MKSHNFSGFDIFASILVILGAIDLGLMGIFQYNLIQSVFGNQEVLIRIVYSLIGAAGVWFIYVLSRCCSKSCSKEVQ